MGRFSRQAKQSAFLLAYAKSQSDAIGRSAKPSPRTKSIVGKRIPFVNCMCNNVSSARAAHRRRNAIAFPKKISNFDRLEIVFHKSHRQHRVRALAIPVVDLRDRNDIVSSLNKFFKRVHRAIKQFQTFSRRTKKKKPRREKMHM